MSGGKVAILNHGYLPHYRVRFYELLAERGGYEYVVFHGAPPSWVGTPELKGPFAFSQRRIENHEFRIGPLTLIYQPVVREILTGGYEAIVITTESKFVSNLMLALLCKLRGIAVLHWGFGYHPPRGSRESDVPNPVMLKITTAIKKGFTRLADGFIAYTKNGAERLIDSGYPRERTFFVQNTIDMTEQLRLYEAERDTDPQAIRREFGLRPDSTVFTFIGRLVQIKRVDQLIEAVRIINERKLSRPVEAVIVGDGMCMDDLTTQAKDVPGIHFLGHRPPNDEVARCLKISAASAVAGMVGLMANHALAHGRPVITRELDTHSPELEYVEHDRNGLIIAGDMDEFAATLARFANDDAWQARLAHGALETRDGLRMDDMAARFDEAVRITTARRQTRPQLPFAQTEPRS